MLVQQVADVDHVRRHGGFEGHTGELRGVDELQAVGMEGLALDEGGAARLKFYAARFGVDVFDRDLPPAIGGVADDGVADVGEVDAELVRATGFGHQFQQGVAGGTDFETFFDVVDRLGRLADIGADGIAFAEFLVDAEGGVDEVGIEFHESMHDGEVGFFNRSPFELPGESPVRFIGFGDEDEACCVTVEPVDDARSPRVGADGELSAGVLRVVHEGVDECARPMAAGGVHDEPRLLVDGNELIILMHNAERNIFRQ